MAKFTKDSKLEDLLDDPEATAILQKYYPVDTSNPLMRMAYGTTLEKCLSFPQVELTDSQKQEMYDELAALG